MISANLHIVHVIHSLGPGGAEHTLIDLADVAPGQNMTLSVVSLMPLDSNLYPQQLRDLGVGVHTIDLVSRWDPRALARGSRVVEDLKPDVIHTHLKHADLVGARSARRLGVPMVSTLHLIEDAPTAVGRAKRSVAAQARLRNAARTIAVSEPLRAWYLATFSADPERVVHIPNGVAGAVPMTADRRRELRRELGLRSDAVVAATVGILRPEKGHAVLLSAAEQMKPGVDLQFLIVGDGPERPAIEDQARSAHLVPDRVVFAGFRTDVREILAVSNFVIHPSLEDALPTALLHALAAGTPIVASDTGGIPEIVTPDIGILVRPGDSDALIDGVEQLLGRLPAPEMRGAARARFAEEYDAAIWAERLRRLYDEVLDE